MATLAEIVRRISANADRIQLSAMKRAEGEFKLRVYTRGEATDGSKLGPYRSEQHKRRRVRRNRQVSNKDLNFEGDLFRGTVTGSQDGKALFSITTNKLRLIAQGQEKQTGKEIFRLSEEETDLAFRTVQAEVEAVLNAR